MKEKETFNEKISLQDYYQFLSNQKNDFIKEIMEKTGKSLRTVKSYLYGETTPDHANKQIISEIAGIPIETLWPEEQKITE